MRVQIRVLCKTWEMATSRHRFAENGKEMYRHKKARKERAKLLLLLIDITLLSKCLVIYHHLLSLIFYLESS